MYYTIQIQGHLDPSWHDRFGGLGIEQQETGTTLLSGMVPDQAALHGVLLQVVRLGLTLLSLETRAGNKELGEYMKQSWEDFALAEPELSAFGETRLKSGPAFLATVRADGMPRVHPVTPIIGEGHLLLFMEPTSPKGHDLQRGSGYALHCLVSSDDGGEGEFRLTGHAHFTDSPAMRELATTYGYSPQDRYILCELTVESAFSTVYPNTGKPVRKSWKSEQGS